MPFNIAPSILGTGNTKDHVEREADVIFTAAFIGMTIWQNKKKNMLTWRIDMEPSTESKPDAKPDGRAGRTVDDQASMKILNDACSKVNHVVRTHLRQDAGGVTWGLTPLFSRGKMIAAGADAAAEYTKVDPKYAALAYTYLTAPQQPAKDGQRANEIYIGRGAYCGIVIDKDGNAVTAMSTIRTTLDENTPGIGTRWLPPQQADVFTKTNKANEPGFTWGMIANEALQRQLSEQGMRFYPANTTPNPAHDMVGYTHGMIRCIYETARMGQGTAFEMSIGIDTAKLASCLTCSSFMMANGVDASSTHVGSGESWVPYYTAESHNPSHYPDHIHIDAAIANCNHQHATCMHGWMVEGVEAMAAAGAWVSADHQDALQKLRARLQQFSRSDNTVARDLFLDALTFHKKDAQRLNTALVYGPSPRKFCNGTYDWIANRQTDAHTKGTWDTFQNPFSDQQITELHTPPAPLVKQYRIRALSPHKEDSLALDYVLFDALGKIAQQGKLDATGGAAFTSQSNLAGWKIKVANEINPSAFTVNTNYPLPGGRYTYQITEA